MLKLKNFPGILIVALMLAMMATACSKYVVHPGAINTFDSQSYDALIITAKITIDTARDEFSSKTLPDRMKPAFNNLVKAYDTAFPVYRAWHDALAAGQPADQKLQELTTDLAAVANALGAFRKGGQ
jgi:hypothetical protein